MKLKRILPWLLVVLVVALLSLVLFTREKAQPPQSFRRPDGSVITFLQITYGSNQMLVWGTPFQRALYKILPARLKSWSKVSVLAFSATQTNIPTFWMHETVPKPNILLRPGTPGTNYLSGQNLPVRLLDEFGCEYNPQGYSTGTQYLPDGIICYYNVKAGDPHGRIVGLSFYDSPDKNERIATFPIAGVVANPLPELKQPTETAGRDGEFAFKLMSFATGMKSEPFAYTKATNGVLFSQASFHIAKNGAPAPGWSPVNLKVTDVNGKGIAIRARSWGLREGDSVFNFEGALDPAAGPFKLHVEFTHQSEFTPDELTTIKDVPFPAASEVLDLQREGEAQGQRFVIEHAYGPFAPKPAKNLPAGEPLIEARLVSSANSVHLELIRAEDESRTKIPVWGDRNGRNGERYFNFQSSAKPKSVTLTFAVHQSRFAEFVATPVLIQTNNPKAQ